MTVLGVILGVTLAIHEITWYLSGKGTTKVRRSLSNTVNHDSQQLPPMSGAQSTLHAKQPAVRHMHVCLHPQPSQQQ